MYGDCSNYNVLTGSKNAVLGVEWASNGNHIVSCSADKTVSVWDANKGVRVRKFTDHEGIVNCLAVAKNDPCKLLLHHGYQRNNWSEYHNPMIPVKREALQTHWRKKKAHQGTKWKRRFDDRQDRYQEDKLLQPPKGVTIEQHNSITWLTGEKKIEVNKSGKKK